MPHAAVNFYRLIKRRYFLNLHSISVPKKDKINYKNGPFPIFYTFYALQKSKANSEAR